jgi:hypothetical protein
MIFFISGCDKRVPLSQLNKDKMYELSIINTRKGEITNLQETKAIIIATYLNPINANFINNKEDVFLIGIYISNDSNSKKKGNNNPFYKFTLNGDSTIDDIQKLNMNSKYLKMIPLINKWAEYYLVKFPAKKSRILTLTFENKDYGKAVLTFEKAI